MSLFILLGTSYCDPYIYTKNKHVVSVFSIPRDEREFEMEAPNQSAMTEFVLLGFSVNPRLEKMFFVLILLMYLVVLLGNGVSSW